MEREPRSCRRTNDKHTIPGKYQYVVSGLIICIPTILKYPLPFPKAETQSHVTSQDEKHACNGHAYGLCNNVVCIKIVPGMFEIGNDPGRRTHGRDKATRRTSRHRDEVVLDLEFKLVIRLGRSHSCGGKDEPKLAPAPSRRGCRQIR